jgi:hypothetical protein
MMFCINCGKEIPDNSNFCLYCGASLIQKDIINIVEKKGKSLVIVDSPKKILYTGSKIKIFIDGNQMRELKNGCSASFEVENGEHTIFCESFTYNRSEAIEIKAKSNEIHFSVTFPSAFGYERKMILTKTMETQIDTWA